MLNSFALPQISRAAAAIGKLLDIQLGPFNSEGQKRSYGKAAEEVSRFPGLDLSGSGDDIKAPQKDSVPVVAVKPKLETEKGASSFQKSRKRQAESKGPKKGIRKAKSKDTAVTI